MRKLKVFYCGAFLPIKGNLAGSNTANVFLRRLRRYFEVAGLVFADLDQGSAEGIQADLLGLSVVHRSRISQIFWCSLLFFVPSILASRVTLNIDYSKVRKSDFIYCEFSQCTVLGICLSRCFCKPLVVSIADVCTLGFKRRFVNSAGIFPRLFYLFEYIKLKLFEGYILRKASLVITQSRKDYKVLRGAGVNVRLCPPYVPKISVNPVGLKSLRSTYMGVFVGHLGRPENRDVADQILKLVKQDRNLRFIVVGKCPDIKLAQQLSQENGINHHVWVNKLDDIYRDADFVYVPLLRGAGIKVKVLEAFAAGSLVLGTHVAFEGISPKLTRFGIRIHAHDFGIIERINSLGGLVDSPERKKQQINVYAEEYATRKSCGYVFSRICVELRDNYDLGH